MDLQTYKDFIGEDSMPSGLGCGLSALWHEARGDWDAAHIVVQDDESREAAWVHAYLHRKEGDLGNAAYWYSRAGRRVSSLPFEKEWEEIVQSLLGAK